MKCFAVVFGLFLDLIFGNVCHVLHLKMFALALAFQDVSVEDVCACISFSFSVRASLCILFYLC